MSFVIQIRGSMFEIIKEILAGGFAGAAVAVYLSKKLVENQLGKTLKKYQHELDIKKDTITTDLSLYANHQSLKLTKYEESMRRAIHNIYNAVIRTSSSKVGFQKVSNLEQCNNKHEFQSQYFDSFSANFQAFSKAFQAVSHGYDVLDKESIYISQDLEEDVKSCLETVRRSHNVNHNDLKRGHNLARELQRQGKLELTNMPYDINEFYNKSTTEWAIRTNHARLQLKQTMRQLLSI